MLHALVCGVDRFLILDLKWTLKRQEVECSRSHRKNPPQNVILACQAEKCSFLSVNFKHAGFFSIQTTFYFCWTILIAVFKCLLHISHVAFQWYLLQFKFLVVLKFLVKCELCACGMCIAKTVQNQCSFCYILVKIFLF